MTQGARSWMEELYGESVDEAIIAVDNQRLSLPSGEGDDHPSSSLDLRSQDLTFFGTKDEIEKSRLWNARWNYTRSILDKAHSDYEANHCAVEEWYLNVIRSRVDVLVDAISKGAFMAPVEREEPGFSYVPLVVEDRNILSLSSVQSSRGTHLHGGYSSQFDGFYGPCGVLADQTWQLRINNPLAMAAVLGCSVGDLPVFLQHYHSEEPYAGNWTLDNVDPMDAFHCMNPWAKFPADVCVHISKRQVRAFTKKPFDVVFEGPDAEFLSKFEQLRKRFGTIIEKDSRRAYRVAAYYGASQGVTELRSRWKRNRRVSVADVFYKFDIATDA